MACTQCMCDQGIELLGPEVDSEGNVQRPELAEGAQGRESVAYGGVAHDVGCF